jgi:hypothetical protein
VMDHVWVRALVALATFLTYSIPLWLLGEFALDHGQGIGNVILYFDLLCVFAAVIVGPAWIFQRVLSGPRGGGGRDGALVPLPVDTVRDDVDEPPIAA